MAESDGRLKKSVAAVIEEMRRKLDEDCLMGEFDRDAARYATTVPWRGGIDLGAPGGDESVATAFTADGPISAPTIEGVLKTMREFEGKKAAREKESGISDEALDTILTGREAMNQFMPPGMKVYEKNNRSYMTVPSKDDPEKVTIINITPKPFEFIMPPIEPEPFKPWRIYGPGMFGPVIPIIPGNGLRPQIRFIAFGDSIAQGRMSPKDRKRWKRDATRNAAWCSKPERKRRRM